MEDLASFDEDLSDCLYKLPTENLPLVITIFNLGYIKREKGKTNTVMLSICIEFVVTKFKVT